MLARCLLTLVALAPAVAAAQDVDAGTPAQTAAPTYKAVKLNPELDKPDVLTTARYFFSAIILGDARQVANECIAPFQLEDRKIANEDDLVQAWSKALRQKRTDLLTLYGVEVLSPTEMEQKYGKAPARLKDFPWKRPGVYLAVGNLSGHPAVAVLQKQPNGDFLVVAYHD